MGAEDFRQLERLFHEALARPPAERAAYLATACDEATTRRVTELLRALEDDPAFLAKPLVSSLATLDVGDLPTGTRIGDYEITVRIGSGGMGHVYRAKDLVLPRDAAVKVLRGPADARQQDDLLIEARHAARLAHPNICTIYQVVQHEGRPCLIMEFVQGLTLEQRLAGGPLPFAAALRYAAQIADALAHAHESGVIHGDLKPANIMVNSHGHVKVLDFGVARMIPGPSTAESSTSTIPAAGTLRYMPPEALRNEPVDARGDLWSCGIVLYEMLAGVAPFSASTAGALRASILRDTPPPLDPGVPPALDAIVRRCLEKEVTERYQSARELRAALDTAGASLGRPASAVTAKRGGWRWIAAALLVAVLGTLTWLYPRRTPPPRDRVAIAVLPLESLSGAEDEYFADGVTEVLIGDLAQVRAIRVTSRQSASAYRRTSTALRDVARTLGVDYLVKGTVMRAGSDVRITAQLLNPFTDEHLWSDSFTRSIQDVLTLQNEVARDIARQVAVTIRPDEARRLSQARSARPEVLNAYLKGRSLWNSRSPRALEQAIDAFETAIQLDPSHAQSFAGLAATYAVQASLGLVSARHGYPRARDAATAALRLDEELAEPHAVLARVKFNYEWDWAGAEREFTRALQINPNFATARQWYSAGLAAQRRFDEALREARRAYESDPLSPIVRWNVARAHFFRGELEAALAENSRVIELDPGFQLAHQLAARIYAQKGDFADALRSVESVPAASRTSDTLAVLAYAHARRGARVPALAVLSELQTEEGSRYVSPYELAKVHVALGEQSKAFAELERAADERSAHLVFLLIDPELAPLQNHPRFRAVADRVGLHDVR
jgi:eukaryotic-like serine/threonine-protein kinase